jgi:hypothetical protein
MSDKGKQISQFLRKKKYLFLATSVIGIIVDIFLFKFTSNLVVLFLTFLWVGAVLGWRLEGRFSILGALIFLIMCPILLVLKKDPVAEKAAVWVYMFLAVGVVQQIIELKRRPSGWIDFDDFIRRLVQIIRAFGQGFVRARESLRRKDMEELAEIAGDWSGQWSVELENKLRLKGVRATGRIGSGLIWLLRNVVENITWFLDFIFKFWLLLFLLSGIALTLWGLGSEILFYREFFEDQYWWQFWQRQGLLLIAFWLLSLGFFIRMLKQHWHSKVKQFLIVLLLIVLWRGDKVIFQRTRAKFEFKPYILRISPDIASRYMEVKIYGRNFRDLPFRSKVLIDGRQQRIDKWSDKLITIIIDPYHSETGKVVVVAKRGDQEVRSNSVKFTYYDSKTATPEEGERFWDALKRLER